MPAPPGRSGFVNPHVEKTRRVGMPAVAGSPLQNRGSYKPLQMKRPLEGGLASYDQSILLYQQHLLTEAS